jgi:hypothetical protein
VTIVVAVAAALAVAASAAALVVVLTSNRSTPPADQSKSSPSASAGPVKEDPPGDVKLADDGSVVTLTWTDPTNGAAQFIVAGGRSGQQQRAMGNIPAGETRYEVNGLNSNLDYCFTVIVVYSTDRLVPSKVVCTDRASSSPN